MSKRGFLENQNGKQEGKEETQGFHSWSDFQQAQKKKKTQTEIIFSKTKAKRQSKINQK